MEKYIFTDVKQLEILILNSIRTVLNEKSLKLTPHHNEERFFNINEAASFLRLATQTIYGFTSKREIPFIKKGKKLYFKKSALEAWLAEGNSKKPTA